MKLKHIVNELERRRGALEKPTPHYIFKYLYVDDSDLSDILSKGIDPATRSNIIGYVSASSKNDTSYKVSQNVRNMILNTGDVVFNKGSVVIVKTTKGNENLYVMYDFNKPANKAEFLAGYIKTGTLNPNRFYSPYTRYGFENTEQIHISMLAAPYQGKGYGKLLYDAILKSTNAVYSDSVLYEGSFNMWIYHIRKNSKFFGIRSDGGLILPIFDDEGISKSVRLGYNYGFVGIRKGVPSELTRLAKFLDGKNPHEIEMLACDVICKLNVVIEKIENSFGSEELFYRESLTDVVLYNMINYNRQKFEYAIINGKDFVLAVKETPNGLDYLLV